MSSLSQESVEFRKKVRMFGYVSRLPRVAAFQVTEELLEEHEAEDLVLETLAGARVYVDESKSGMCLISPGGQLYLASVGEWVVMDLRRDPEDNEVIILTDEQFREKWVPDCLRDGKQIEIVEDDEHPLPDAYTETPED